MNTGRDSESGKAEDTAGGSGEVQRESPRASDETPHGRNPWLVPLWAVGLYSLFFGTLGVYLAWLVLLQIRTTTPHQPTAPVLLTGLAVGMAASYLACVFVTHRSDEADTTPRLTVSERTRPDPRC